MHFANKFSKSQIMRLQVLASHGFTLKVFPSLGDIVRKVAGIFTITFVITTTYASNASQTEPMPDLTPQERSYINSLSQNLTKIPAWLIAQLLDVSDQLSHLSTSSQPAWPKVRLSELLASPDHYRGRVIAIRGYFVESSDVRSELQLPPSDHCWSVIVLDAEYHRPLQYFTTLDPKRFKKHSAILAIGLYLTNRMDQSRNPISPETLSIPVFVGTMIPDNRPSEPRPFFDEKFFSLVLVAVIILLGIGYFVLRAYISKRFSKRKDAVLRLPRGDRHEEGPPEPGR